MKSKTAPLPAHSMLGASSASRWLNCPGSFALCQTVPPGKSSIYAATGTLAHSFIEGCLQTPITRMDHTSIGNAYRIEGHEIIVDEDMIDGINVMVDYVAARAPEFTNIHVEKTVHLDEYFSEIDKPPVRMFGRCDVVMDNPELMEIVDYKNGSGVIVDPVNNAQTLYYAAGAITTRTRKVGRQEVMLLPDKVMMTIVQPHARSVAKVRSTTIDTIDLLLWVDETLVPGALACGKPDAPLVPGSWCRFCPAAHACPKLEEDAVAMAKLEFNDDRIKIDDPAELSRVLDMIVRARAYCDAVDAYALEQLKAQVRIPNWSLVPTRPVRRWTDEEFVGRALTEAQVPNVYRSELKSPAQVEKLVRRHLSNDAWEDQFSRLVESKSGGVKLHRDNDTPMGDYEC